MDDVNSGEEDDMEPLLGQAHLKRSSGLIEPQVCLQSGMLCSYRS